MLEPRKGILTFRAEGNNYRSSRDYSRKLHWPGNSLLCKKENSGVTIGRGFDLGERTEMGARMALIKAGIEPHKAEKISKAAKKKGCEAYHFVIENRDLIEEITELQQLRLFEITYRELEKDVERISKSLKNIRNYHPNPATSPPLAWENIPEKIKDILIDLRYRGDFTPKTREYILGMAYAGDKDGFGKILSNRRYWIKVPKDRFNRRVDYYEEN